MSDDPNTNHISPLSEFWKFASDFHNVYAQIAKFAIAAPLLDLIICIGPPWPGRFAVSFSSVIVQILIIMCSFAFWRQGRTPLKVIKKWLLIDTVIFIALFLLVYIPLFAFFVVPSPDYRNAAVRGYEYQEPFKKYKAILASKGETVSPKSLIAENVDAKNDVTAIWTYESVMVGRSALLIVWLLVVIAYAGAVSAFISIQYRRIK